MHEDLVTQEKELRDHVVRSLAGTPVDYMEEMRFIRERVEERKKWRSSGVLIPLEFDPGLQEYVVILNKRSASVQQPGDLCCPGGRTDRRYDRALAFLLVARLLPVARSAPLRRLVRLRGPERDALLMLLAGVLRESWEEMRLPPWRVEYLGSIPAQRLLAFPGTIFPLVGRIQGTWKPRPNWEVEKILRVPLRHFFASENYALCRFCIPSSAGENTNTDLWEMPCLLIEDGGREEVLWGATFRILVRFIERVFGIPVASIQPARRVTRNLPAHYFSGRSAS